MARSGLAWQRPATHGRLAGIAALAGVLAFGGATGGLAEVATPDPAPLTIILNDTEGEEAGSATVSEVDGVATLDIAVSGLEPGDHGIHIHETGSCDPAGDGPFASAGGHFNPGGAQHGAGPQGHGQGPGGPGGRDDRGATTPGTGPMLAHAGDLGNITVGEDGTGSLIVATDQVTLAPGAENSLADADGSALVIHAGPDDLTTDPAGNSGDRIACGVIFPPVEGGTPPVEASEDDEDAEGEAEAGEDDGAWRVGDEPVEALDLLKFEPAVIRVAPGDTIQAINTGALEHDFVVDALGINVNLPNGQVVDIQVPEDAAPGEYEFYCSVPGHKAAGMFGTLIIEG